MAEGGQGVSEAEERRLARRETFERAAVIYDEVRPGYPEALFDDIVALAGLPPGGRILEIGCGTGKATVPFARRGFRIACVELGANLAAVARRKLAPYPDAEVAITPFEEYPVEPATFDLVSAATMFHWLDPAVALPKVARALKPGGSLAVFRHHHVATERSAGFHAAIQSAYWRAAPEMARRFEGLRPPEAYPATEEPNTAQQIKESGLFEPVVTRHYVWDEEYDATGYVGLLSSYSDHLALDPDARRRLFDGIAEVIDHQFGGRIVKGYLALLHVARRR